MYATPTRFIQFDTWAELEAPGIADLPKVLMSHGYTTISSGKIYHKRLDNEHSWNEICGFGIVSQPSPYRRCPKLRSLDNQTSNLLVSHCVMSRPPPAGNACVLLSQPRKVLRMSEQSVACVSARVVCVGSFVGRVGIACLLAVPVASWALRAGLCEPARGALISCAASCCRWRHPWVRSQQGRAPPNAYFTRHVDPCPLPSACT